jgi:hypothetical protein
MAESGDIQTQQGRALQLFFERWFEQLTTSFTPRRARTLGALSALDELVALAEAHVRSGGRTRPAVDPDDAGHGVRMLPDVAVEAGQFLSSDEILSHEYPARKQVLQDLAGSLQSAENVSQELIEQVKALLSILRGDYVEAAFRTLSHVVAKSPKSSAVVMAIADSTVSELRSRGWSDEGLNEAGKVATQAAGPDSSLAVATLLREVTAPLSLFECYVGVSLPTRRPPFPNDEPSFAIVDELPPGVRQGRPIKGGPYLRARVKAYDAAAAAALAHQRSISTLGALKVFLPGSPVDVSTDVVAVVAPNGLKTFEVQEKLLEEHRVASQDEIARILVSSWRVHELRAADPLHDAIRLRHRALIASDPESRLLLLWSGMERMTAGARGFDAALSAARELASHAVAFGKLRRDVGDLVACFTHHVARDNGQRKRLLDMTGATVAASVRVDRERFLEYFMGDESRLRELTAVVYDGSPLLAFRCYELWKALGGGNRESAGAHLAEYLERSRERVARQVGRIYRARNRIAHVGASPDRIRDLVWHAHFYLTQLTAICVHYSERENIRAQDLLLRRVGQYKALIKLLKANDSTLITARNLMRPSLVVG